MALRLLECGRIATLEMSIRGMIYDPKSRRIVLVLALVAAAVQFVRSSVGTLSIVDGLSMYPTFHPNDVVQARTSYAGAQRGDVVIVAGERGEQMIKRIVGLPGETVTVYRGFVYINHQRLNEPYLPKFTYTFKSNERSERAENWQLAGDEYFVLGDNRSQSTDSRHYGPVAWRQIQSVVNTPANAARPGFCGIMLSENGEVMLAKHGHPLPGPEPPARPRSEF